MGKGNRGERGKENGSRDEKTCRDKDDPRASNKVGAKQ